MGRLKLFDGRGQTRYAAGLALLAALLLLTWGLRAWRVAQVESSVEARQEEAVERALAEVGERFDALQTDLLRRAQQAAEAPAVAEGLRTVDEGGSTGPLVAHMAALELPERLAVEVYNPTPHLAAWQGFSVPLDEAPNTEHFLKRPQTVLATEGSLRRVLVAWWPVRSGGRTLGAVRAMQTVRFQVPVQNEYLQNYSLAEEWSRATGLSVSVRWNPADTTRAEEASVGFLRGAGSEVLGRVTVEPPTVEQLVQNTQERFDDVLALWATLLLLWGAAGLWTWYRRGRRTTSKPTVHRSLLHLAGRFAVVAAALVGVRYALLWLQVPARWQEGEVLLAPLFDPRHLASTLGGGAMSSAGALLITASFALLLAVAFLDLAFRFRGKSMDLFRLRGRVTRSRPAQEGPGLGKEFLFQRSRSGAFPSLTRLLAVLPLATVVVGSLVYGLSVVARRAVLDSQLDYFARTGLLPEPLVLAVFCALLLLTTAVVVATAGVAWVAVWFLMRYWPGGFRQGLLLALLLSALTGTAVGFYALTDMQAVAPWSVALAFLASGVGMAALGFVRRGKGLELLTLRRLLPLILLIAVLLYPLIYQGMNAKRHSRIMSAAESFGEGHDSRAAFSIEQVLQEGQRAPALRAALARAAGTASPARLDSLATELLRGSLLRSLGAYQVSLAFFDTAGAAIRRYAATGLSVEQEAVREDETLEFAILREMYADQETTGVMVEQMTGRRQRERFQYVGLVPLYQRSVGAEADSTHAGWLMVRAEQQQLLAGAGTPFPRVLLPESYYGERYASLSLAEFRDGVLVRSLGRDFGRYRLGEEVHQALGREPVAWRKEEGEGRLYLTMYQHRYLPPNPAQVAAPPVASVVAVRVPAIVMFDHLYYMLRLAVAGFCIGGVLYLMGLFLRWQRGQLPAPRVQFQDKMQNAFLIVGIVSVSAVGLVGLRVLTGENRRATQDRLQRQLEQVEEMLALDAQGDEPTYRVVERLGVDSLAVRAGLDLNLYDESRLVASSRPRLARERLINDRLAASAYRALYFDGYRFTTTQEWVGRFRYTAGYRALVDEQGRPRYVLSAPTLPEQERIEEEQARTVAYLFGALLLLIVLVMITAWLLARALARPIARLRSGLEAVGKGEFARKLPVDTRDEIGELVATFNEMRDQLAESRRKLAQQERELAWREMARQVAHEIKNPLTPMKLSMQHLKRAFERLEVPESEPPAERTGEERRFAALFDRITTTLIEQIDTLARIANEFSTFARLPTRVKEPIDLNETIEEAASLMQEETSTALVLDLWREPLVVEADQEELRRIYINLFKNALQAIPEDRRGRVEVATRRGTAAPVDGQDANEAPDVWAESTVTDNGTGIPKALQDKIFQPNFSTKNSGTGLGLAIVRKSVEEMGGAIEFETEEGQGTTFRIRLPLAG